MKTDNIGYWQEVSDLLAKGEITVEQAMIICQNEPYAMDVTCQKFLGEQYYDQNDFNTAFEWYAKAAEQGDAEALFSMGSINLFNENSERAISLYKKALDKGFLVPLIGLGIFIIMDVE